MEEILNKQFWAVRQSNWITYPGVSVASKTKLNFIETRKANVTEHCVISDVTKYLHSFNLSALPSMVLVLF